MSTSHLLLGAALTLPFAALPCQQTLVVGAGGTFTTIGAAIAAAAPGDTVLVQGGSYIEGFVIDKGIRLVGRNASFSTQLLADVQVQNLPAGQTFTMTGFSAMANGFNPQIQVSNCAGRIELGRLSQSGLRTWRVNATDTAQLFASGCVFNAVSLTDTDAVLTGCVFDPDGFFGMLQDGGRVAIVRCTVNGGPVGGSAIWLADGELAVTRGSVRALASPGSAIHATGGTILLDPSVVLSAANNDPVISGSGTVAPYEFGSVVASTDGQMLSVEAHGPANAAFATLLSLPGPIAPTPFGLAWIDPTNYGFLTHGVFPGTRLHTHSLAHPPLPPGLGAAIQVAYLTPNGVALGTPAIAIAP